ncbi:MAG: hypothetical protein JWQ81_2526 [Amycolatopsis sp.]|uniref:hypothetical protein n=1 Tax=Amycolatopsis sp. TaxID=37632 RepID=UPI0026143D4B|nr:hypothetical protein [Amycolatopsis sp.]MCU1681787.1 hypothetical protein [Amycolatopsis sp.]
MALRLGFATSVARAGADPDLGHIGLVDRLLDQQPVAGADLVVLAYANADRNGHQTVASYLNMRTGDEAHSFALSGQGDRHAVQRFAGHRRLRAHRPRPPAGDRDRRVLAAGFAR